MKPAPILCLLAGLALSGCKPPTASLETASHGRYVGVGLYAAGEGWKRLADPAPPKGGGKAGLADDEQVIVTVDSQTGEIRQCGALSGYCVTMKPWDHSLSQTQTLPAALAPPPAAVK